MTRSWKVRGRLGMSVQVEQDGYNLGVSVHWRQSMGTAFLSPAGAHKLAAVLLKAAHQLDGGGPCQACDGSGAVINWQGAPIECPRCEDELDRGKR